VECLLGTNFHLPNLYDFDGVAEYTVKAALKINQFLCKSGGFSVANGLVDFSSEFIFFPGFCHFPNYQ
jgi:hypothetical protein